MKFIDIGKLPVTPGLRLEVILHAKRVVKSSSPYPDLDQLYSQILRFCINEGGKLRKILLLIVSPFSQFKALKSSFQLRGSHSFGMQSLWALEQLLDLSEGGAAALLSGLRSILDIPSSTTDNVRVLHASFSDFLLDPNPADEYYVGPVLSSWEWSQLHLACQIRMLSQFCNESQSERWSMHSQDYPINGIHDVDIGALDVWKYLYEYPTAIINDDITVALNAFDPHLYLATVLHWNYESIQFLDHGSPLQRNEPSVFRVSRFSLQDGKFRDWRYQTVAVHHQISILYSAFQSLKELDRSRSSRGCLQKFFERCSSFFHGFHVSFPRDQDEDSIRYTLLACQLSISGLYSQYSDRYVASPVIGLKPIYGHFDISLKIVPSENDAGRHSTVQLPARWEVKYIDPTQGRLLRKLLELLTDYEDREGKINTGIPDVFASSEMEDWNYKLARLNWVKTWRTYLFGKLAQRAQAKEGSKQVFELNGQGILEITTHTQRCGVVVTGMPGIGKSVFPLWPKH
ncbi:hypothetical protein E1B28_010388 [Marasmius oreades]|uniref:Uncharacterized protein n=1 Tax=Marasmius oreades TaxID=181124 RepID=A0A9P7RX22_9AGAR|nr:uncharacterized protein E1B28_010388 [Marasmius oreades]KAG7091346.1 hypothetical protein E1B28_010388 [Marasmius oreades]